eukprot:4012126-Pyramimonas_sp.AAC.1
MGAADANGRWHWGLRWSSLWGPQTCQRGADMGVGTHACGGTGDLGGDPYGITKRVRALPK